MREAERLGADRRRPARPQPDRDPGVADAASRCRSRVLIDEAVDRVRPAADGAGIALQRRRRAPGAMRRRATGARCVSAIATCSTTRSSTRSRASPVDDRRARRRRWLDDHGARPRHRDPDARPRADLRALLPRRPGAQPRRPVAPASASRSCATSRRRTAATSPSSRVEGEGSTFPLRAPRSSAASPLPLRYPRRSGLMAEPPLDPRRRRRAVVPRRARGRARTRGVPRRDRGRRRRGDRALRASRPALVLLDVMLPQISGVDVCREIRARSRVPIIMVTARTPRSTRSSASRSAPTTT